eukprot:7566751-Pyramimonas_sp.AAC.1
MRREDQTTRQDLSAEVPGGVFSRRRKKQGVQGSSTCKGHRLIQRNASDNPLASGKSGKRSLLRLVFDQ